MQKKATKHHCFRLVHKNCQPGHTQFGYTTLHVQRCGLNKAMKRLYHKYPRLEISLDLPFHPNGISMNNCIKKALNNSVKFRFNDLHTFMNEKELVDNITRLYKTL